MSYALFAVMLASVLSLADSQRQGVVVNGFFDTILDRARQMLMVQDNYTVMPIPDLDKEYKLNLLVGSVTASLTATDGRLSDLTTLRRVGDAVMITRGTTVFFTASVTLDTLKVVFGHYTLAVGFLKHSADRLALHVGKNLLDTIIEVRLHRLECKVKVVKIKLREFSDVTVDITGFSILNPIGSKVAEWIISFFHGYIKGLAETYTMKMVNYTVGGDDLCSPIFRKIAGTLYKEDNPSNVSLSH